MRINKFQDSRLKLKDIKTEKALKVMIISNRKPHILHN